MSSSLQSFLMKRSFNIAQKNVLRRRKSSSIIKFGGVTSSRSHDHVPLVVQQQQRREKSSSFFSSSIASVQNSIVDSVKSSILNDAAREDSKIWLNGDSTSSSNGNNDLRYKHNQQEQIRQKEILSSLSIPGNTINDTLSSIDDPLDEWHLDKKLQYWPNLPENVREKENNADPFMLGKEELKTLSASIRGDLLGSNHPVLSKAASYFFEDNIANGKRVRPLMVFLLSRALSDTIMDNSTLSKSGNENASTIEETSSSSSLFSSPASWQRPDLPDAQRRLGEISEMIHTASLVHDDVIDEADTRRGVSAVHAMFGNKVAILAGDYLLARASIYLARLRNVDVVESMSTIVENLCRGEVMQIRGVAKNEETHERLTYYLRKTYYKTGSLMANSCESAALLGNYPQELVDASYRYGKHVGLAFQLVDDVLDFEGNLAQLGKPSLSDLKSGLSTAPVLFASEEYPELIPMMERKFRNEGDIEKACELVIKSNGIQRTKDLACIYAEVAIESMLHLNGGQHRDSLIHLAHMIVSRSK